MSVDWTKDFYSKTGTWWGPAEAKITESDKRRTEIVKKFVPESVKVLELGCGYGNSAYAVAAAGYDITAVEISDRINFADSVTDAPIDAKPLFVKQDFYKVNFDKKFDAVLYWNGFGIGDDKENRKLLMRISEEWLTPDGVALIDIANPFVWASWDGDEESKSAKPEVGYGYNLTQHNDFDPVNNRFVDSWWETNKPDQKITQNIRAYTPADLMLLLEGTGLVIERIIVGGEELSIGKSYTGMKKLLKDDHEYLVILKKE
jgi:SAM-dependent methyltransferase